MLGPLEISDATNLPEGTVLPIWVEGDYPACAPNCSFEMEQVTIRNGHFQTTAKDQDPAPGRYTVHVTTTTASAEPSNVGAILGASGQNLRGPNVAALSDGGKYVAANPDRDDASRYLTSFLVHYAQRIEIGDGGEVTVYPKRNTADDCGIPVPTPSSASANGPSAELPVTQPADTGR
jgi:hypothetical protein